MKKIEKISFLYKKKFLSYKVIETNIQFQFKYINFKKLKAIFNPLKIK